MLLSLQKFCFFSLICLLFVSSFSREVRAQEKPLHTNRLANESSPYLLLHAHNPVDWYPWGPEALALAKQQNKPIFLSVGYSSCFWCHVMERKVFEDDTIAAYMNQNYINIKVDREERPDLDDIYMLSLQVYLQMAGSNQGGGWPLSMFLTPSGKPIAGGTYFPPEDMPGRPGFLTVMKQVHAIWNTRQPDVLATADIIAQEVQRLSKPGVLLKPVDLSTKLIDAVVESIQQQYDPEHGGFDFNATSPDGPKFPVPSKVQLMQLRAGTHPEIAKMVDRTLQAMAAGGIQDHLGGGFHRYSTDREWLVPHFEKMLYDNAQLAELYIDAFRRTSKQSYRKVAERTLDFVLRDLNDSQGGFYSALDAETNGIEGEYYVWKQLELDTLLSPPEMRIASSVYGINGPLVFEHGYVLHYPQSIEESADKLGISVEELDTRLIAIQKKLFTARQQRPALLRDDKILTSWNGLTIRAFAEAGKTFQRRDYLQAAEKAAIYVLSTLRDPAEGHLLRTARGGDAKLRAYVEDYAFLVSGLLALHRATGEDKWLSTAKRLTDEQINLFWDKENGGFFYTMHEHEELIARPKSAYDSVIPSGNSVSVQNLVLLAKLTSDDTYRRYAEETLRAFSNQLQSNPGSLAYMAIALENYLQLFGTPETGTPAAADLFTGGVSSPKMEPTTSAVPASPTPQANAQAPLIVQLKPDPAEAAKHPRITTRGYLSVDQLPPGGTCLIALEIDIAQGWHINANPAQSEFVIPSQLTFISPAGFELNQVRYPTGHAFELEGIEEPVSVYEGKVFLTGELKIPATASGMMNLEFQLKYQACNHMNCERPLRISLTGNLPVGPGKPINQELFLPK